MAELLYQIGRFCAHHARKVIAVWGAVLALAAAAFLLFGGALTSTFDIPGTPTAQVTDKLKASIPDASGGTGILVIETEDGGKFTDEQREAIADRIERSRDVAGVNDVVDPFAIESERSEQREQLADGRTKIDQGREQLAAAEKELDEGQATLDEARAQAEAAGAIDQAAPELDGEQAKIDAGRQELDDQRAELESQETTLERGEKLMDLARELRMVSEDGSTAIVTVVFDEPIMEVPTEAKDGVVAPFHDGPIAGVNVYESVEMLEAAPNLFGPSEAVGLGVAAIVLVVMLGTLIGAGLPILNALVGVGIGSLITMSLSGVVQMASITPILGIMLGLAVGIDYSLFIVNRHRRQLKEGYAVDESIALANGTSGNAVVFAGTTVLIALLALNITGIPFLGLMGSTAALCIAVAVAVAVTFTPAMLRLVGERILSRKERAAVTTVHPDAVDESSSDAGSTVVSRDEVTPMSTPRALIGAVFGIAVLVVMALPMADMRLNFPDGSAEPRDSTQHVAYTTVEDKFGEGRNASLLVVADLPEGLDDDEVEQRQLDIAERVYDIPGITAVAPIGKSDDNRVLAFQATPDSGPTAEPTQELVHTIRDLDIDGVDEIGVAGTASGNVDISEKLADALPPFLAVVVGLSLIVLILVFRSLFVPLIASLGFVLSYAATLGGTVFIYQWGNLAQVFGVESPGPILNFLPTIVVGILFGLAMDYMLFIATGMREQYAHGMPARLAVVAGLRAGRGVVIAAALIMISVFGGFIFAETLMIRPIGFALALGVLVDAFIVRLVIIPALMHLVGDGAWWLPKWLDRILPDVDVEGAKLERRHAHEEPANE